MEPVKPVAATEVTPLLGAADDLGPSSPAPSSAVTVQSKSGRGLRLHLEKWSALYLCGLFVFLVDFGSFMGESSRLRMLELGLCREYYSVADPSLIGDDGSIPEHLCKIREVQSALAKMKGFLGSLENLPGLVLAVPFGILADARGRKLVTSISLFGIVLRDLFLFFVLSFYKIFPLWSAYCAPAFVVIGGGPTVLSATVLAMVAAGSTAENRTQSFFYLSVTILASELVSPPVGSVLMERIGAHATFLIGVPILLVGYLVLPFMQEDADESRCADETSDCSDGENDNHSSTTFKGRLKQNFAGMIQFIRDDVGAILGEKTLLLGLLCIAIQKLARPMLELLLQYMSVTFGWPLSRTAYVISAQAAVQIVLFVWIVPQGYRWLLTKRNNDAGAANLALARLCVFFLAVGSLCMALAPVAPLFIIAVMVYTCGTGYANAMRSFLTLLLHKNRITTLYTTMALIDGLASLAASPLLGLTLSAGLEIGGLGVALPFFIAAALYVVAGAGVWIISPKSTERHGGPTA